MAALARNGSERRVWHHRCLIGDPFLRLAVVGGAGDPAECARAARMLVAERLPEHPFDAAVRVKRVLAARGFRDDASAFALHDMLARRAGNCLGLTLLVGAVLIDRGHEVEFVVRLDPLDDVHDAGVEFYRRLHDPQRGVDPDSRLPEARDRAAQFRFAPVEHASIVLPGQGGDRAFEATNLVDLEVPPGWAPVAEATRRIGFIALTSAVWCERAKALVRESCIAGTRRSSPICSGRTSSQRCSLHSTKLGNAPLAWQLRVHATGTPRTSPDPRTRISPAKPSSPSAARASDISSARFLATVMRFGSTGAAVRADPA